MNRGEKHKCRSSTVSVLHRSVIAVRSESSLQSFFESRDDLFIKKLEVIT